MDCPKCKTANPDDVQFCTRCHATLRYICPSCKHDQAHGGTCDQCGVDFAKYAVMMHFQAKATADKERARSKSRSTLVRQILLLPLTGGLSLLNHLRSKLRGD